MKGRLAAIILAAGKGNRIGGPKLSLELGGVPFWRLMTARLNKAGIRDIAVVVRLSGRRLPEEDRRVKVLVNWRPSMGMFSSLRCGLRAMKGFSGYLLCPVDHPGVQAKTYKKLSAFFFKRQNDVVRPLYGGRPGHPIVISEKVAELVRKAEPTIRLDKFISKNKLVVGNIEVMDKGILLNINTEKELSLAREHYRDHKRRCQG